MGVAKATGLATPDELDMLSAATDVVFWVYAGVLVGVAVGLVRRVLRPR